MGELLNPRFESIFTGFQFPRKRPSFLQSNTGRFLEVDGYCEELQLAFERQGEQHYVGDHFFYKRRRDSFPEQVARDKLKVLQCAAAGVRLVVAPCSVHRNAGPCFKVYPDTLVKCFGLSVRRVGSRFKPVGAEVPCYVKDLWTFIRLYPLRWFEVRDVSPLMLVE